jgi:hypothetical protein
MDSANALINKGKPTASVDDLKRLQEVRRLLMSVLKPEEIKAIHAFFSEIHVKERIGNIGDS